MPIGKKLDSKYEHVSVSVKEVRIGKPHRSELSDELLCSILTGLVHRASDSDLDNDEWHRKAIIQAKSMAENMITVIAFEL